MSSVRALRVLRARGDAVRDRVAREVAGALATGGSPAAAEVAFATADREAARALARSGATIACAAGCSWCCHVHVDATAPEVLAAATHLRRTRTAGELAAIRDALAARVAQVAGATDEERWRAKIPCALLEGDGRCAIYAARPLRCRAFHSCSAEPCRAAFEGREADPIASPPLARAHDAVEAGYDRALEGAGLSKEAQRLEPALLAALDDG